MMQVPIARRTLLQAAGCAPLLAVAPTRAATPPRSAAQADAGWIDGAPSQGPVEGATFGLAWPQGLLRAAEPLSAVDASGVPLPLQSWTLARWPDGSRKWTGHALPATASAPDKVRIRPGTPVAPATPVRVRTTDDAVEI